MRLLLVDGHYYLYRSFFAIRGLKNSRGEPTNAIYGFLKALRKMLADLRPDRAAVIWDCGLPTRRTELQPAYKQNRTEMPDDLRPQENWLQKNTPLLGVACVESQNTEADDLIASYAKKARLDGAEVVIATNDKDILQLVGERLHIYSTNKTDLKDAAFALLGTDEVAAKWSVPPAHIADVLALTGDSSDNIPGVSGIGEKTAASLVNEHGGISKILENPDSIPNSKLREKIIAHRDLILANREMVRLDDDLALPVPWESLAIRPRYPELLTALRDCEFQSLLKEIEAESGLSVPSPAPATTSVQGELF
ncbi:MAG: 5'-3' exonuclease H3TH domain-containing protein [Verrucomicrobiota bacterium]